MNRREFLGDVQRIVWLEPSNPYPRDLYALVLLKEKDRHAGLAEVRKSALFSPALDTHPFLFSSRTQLAHLPSDERDALEAGLTEAAARHYDGAVQSLGDFYDAIGEPARAAGVYLGAAALENDQPQRSTFLAEAGMSEAAVNDLDRAQVDFEKAISFTPKRVELYEHLINVMLRRKDVNSARVLADEAIKNGADPLPLYASLAQSETALGQLHSAEAVELKALNNYPNDPGIIRALGTIYLSESRYTDAAVLFRRLCDLRPDAADGFFYLGEAQERDYQYSAAETAFQRAMALSPGNLDYRKRYEEFESNLARNRKAATAEH